MLSRDFYRFIVFEAFRKLIIGAFALSLTLIKFLKPSLALTLAVTSDRRKEKKSIYVMAIDHVTNGYSPISSDVDFECAYRIQLFKMHRVK